LIKKMEDVALDLNKCTEENVRRALCVGYYTKTAYALNRQGYRTVLNSDDGSARIVFIDPSSCLSDTNNPGAAPAWVLYHELVATSKLHMRNVSAVRKEWVEPLLPKLESTDVNRLNGYSNMSKNEMAKLMESQSTRTSLSLKLTNTNSNSNDDSSTATKTEQSARATSKTSKTAIELARERFLQRKRERDRNESSKRASKKNR